MAVTDHPATEVRPDEFAYVGPGTLAGCYLRSFWQPIYLAADLLPGRAVPLHIFGEDLTLYRGESGPSPLAGEGWDGGKAPGADRPGAGDARRPPSLTLRREGGGNGTVLPRQGGGNVHLVAFRCAHRGTQLSTGWVEGDEIRCFYHGWKYDGNGQCTEQPAEPEPFCAKIKIKSYPVQEYLGLIFAYLGESEASPFPRYPQLEGEGVIEAHSYVRECSYFNSIENNMDEVHIAFVHRSSEFSAAGLNASLPEISGEETDYGMVRYGKRPNGATRVLHLVMPNLLVFKGAPVPDSGETEGREQFAWRVPIDDYTHRSFNLSFIHATGEAAERYRARMENRQGPTTGPSANELVRAALRGELHVDELVDRADIVNIQDAVAQAGQGAIPDRASDHLGHTDALLVVLRRIWLRELQALAEGRPLKQWDLPDRLEAAFGV